jgi:hypothetical protein
MDGSKSGLHRVGGGGVRMGFPAVRGFASLFPIASVRQGRVILRKERRKKVRGFPGPKSETRGARTMMD